MLNECRRCGRVLKSQESIKRGFGRTCYLKVQPMENQLEIETKKDTVSDQTNPVSM